MTTAARSEMPPIATIDVSLPPTRGTLWSAMQAAWDVFLALLLVLALPLIVVIGAPVVFVALVGTMITQRFQKSPR